MKKIIVLFVSAILCVSFVACGGSGGGTTSETAEPEPKEPPNLVGTWEQTNKNSETDYMTAEIYDDGTMRIDWVFEEDDTTALYWAGSYTAPTEAIDKYTWTSKNDTAQTDMALMASTSETKDFTYKDGVISFDVSVMDVTTTVEMEMLE